MVIHLPLMRPFDVITFDCYGTLIDWETGITEAFRDAAAADGVRLDPAAVLPALLDTRPAAEAPVYRSYREILTDAAARVGGRLGWTMSRERAAFLPESLPRWRPFPDTNAALERLNAAGYRDPVQCGRRSAGGHATTPDGQLLVARHRAAGPILQAGPGSLHHRAGPDRRPAMASRRAELLPRREAGRRARHPGGLDQPERRAARASSSSGPEVPDVDRAGRLAGVRTPMSVLIVSEEEVGNED